MIIFQLECVIFHSKRIISPLSRIIFTSDRILRSIIQKRAAIIELNAFYAGKAKRYFAKWMWDHYDQPKALMLKDTEEVSDP